MVGWLLHGQGSLTCKGASRQWRDGVGDGDGGEAEASGCGVPLSTAHARGSPQPIPGFRGPHRAQTVCKDVPVT